MEKKVDFHLKDVVQNIPPIMKKETIEALFRDISNFFSNTVIEHKISTDYLNWHLFFMEMIG